VDFFQVSINGFPPGAWLDKHFSEDLRLADATLSILNDALVFQPIPE
jgi:hypothetical protein